MAKKDTFSFNQATIALIVIVLLLVAFFTGLTEKFYATFVFLFYSWTKRMWVSVMLLGVFQTILLIPIRIINIRRSTAIETVVAEVEEIKSEEKQYSVFRQYFSAGNRPTLFYSVSFYIQLISFISIGRLFLTDYYSVPLDPALLFPIAPYPTYPIKDVILNIPYPFPNHFIDSGIAVFLVLATFIVFAKYSIQKTFQEMYEKRGDVSLSGIKLNRYVKGYIQLFAENSIVLLIIAWIAARNFPIDWHLHHFMLDVTHPSPPLNTTTALITFGTVLWLNRGQIQKKIEAFIDAGLDVVQADKERTLLWRDAFINATLIGLAAYFMTNQIPSAFELSVFTLEMISLLAPFTIDKLFQKRPQKSEEKK